MAVTTLSGARNGSSRSLWTSNSNLYLITLRRIRPDHDEEGLAFTSVDGAPLKTGEFRNYLRKVSGARRNAELNGIVCRGLLAARKLKGTEEKESTEKIGIYHRGTEVTEFLENSLPIPRDS